jgi:hypothetical protein
MTQFHLDELNSFVNALADASGSPGGGWGWRCAHPSNLIGVTAEG